MKFTVEWHYRTPKKLETIFRSEEMSLGEVLVLSDDLEKTGRTKELIFIDDQGTTWTKKELQKWLKKSDTEMMDIVTYFDGGFDVKTNLAGIGIVIYYTKNNKHYRVRMNARLEELETNNEAEYAACYFLIQQLEQLDIKSIEVEFRGDSQVVLQQLSGEWPCYDDTLNRWLDKIEQKLKELKIRPTFSPVSRKQNTEADQLATQALEGTPIQSTMELEQRK